MTVSAKFALQAFETTHLVHDEDLLEAKVESSSSARRTVRTFVQTQAQRISACDSSGPSDMVALWSSIDSVYLRQVAAPYERTLDEQVSLPSCQ